MPSGHTTESQGQAVSPARRAIDTSPRCTVRYNPLVSTIGIAIIGSGYIALANHMPGFALCPQAKVVALCDSDPAVLHRARQQTGIDAVYNDYRQAIARDDVHAIVIATPNYLHSPIALAAIAAGKHVMCEKPIAMSQAEAMGMYKAAEAAGIRHMTAFTYRFIPTIRYMAHLIGQGAIGRPYHFRASRFQDWGTRNLGWRQIGKLAGTGELGDMLSHRIDYGHMMLGPIARLICHMKQFVPQRQGAASDLEDWVGMLVDFAAGATGVLESSKLATGRGEGPRSPDSCEVNGAQGTLMYRSERPQEVLMGKLGGAELQTVAVPDEFLKHPASPRDPHSGDPRITFRYDQNVEFVDAIVNQRPCQPSFLEGAAVQAVIDAAVVSAARQGWVDVPQV